MFNSLGWPEIAVLLILGLFVFGPDRLPGVAAQAGRALRSFRSYARGIRDDLADDLGPEIRQVNLRTLQNPRSLLVKHVLGESAPAEATGRRDQVRGAADVPAARTAPIPQQTGGPTGHGPTTSPHGGNHG